MSTFLESDYEREFCQQLEQVGWQYCRGDSLHRLLTEVLLVDDLRLSLQQRYPTLSTDEIEVLLSELQNISSPDFYTCLRDTVLKYRDGTHLRDDDTSGGIDIDYIDFEHPTKNFFRVINQFVVSYDNGRQKRIPDVLLFINGIPVCIIELKNPTDYNATLHDAYDQIHIRYQRDIPHLLRYCALSCISDGSNSRLGTLLTSYTNYYAWKQEVYDTTPAQVGLPQMVSLIRGALSPERILMLLRDFCYFPDNNCSIHTELVCRYPQFFATIALRDNILHSAQQGDGKGGTYWGATGCGKTYTMLFLARQLALRCPQLTSPTIVLLVDREDLQRQSEQLFTRSKDFLRCGIVRIIDSRSDLQQELSARTSGGLFICTIQKFCEQTGCLSTRQNIVCFSDEAHRTQIRICSQMKIDDTRGAIVSYGFAKYLRDAFPKATYVGFTGTPIEQTIQVFGDIVQPSYTMCQSVNDGITVTLKYIPRLAHVLLDNDKVQAIEDYYEQCYNEGATEEDINRSKTAMSSMEVILGDNDRLIKVAQDIANHFTTLCQDQPALPQKGMIVCANRKIAYDLYTILVTQQPEWIIPKGTPMEYGSSEIVNKMPLLTLVATRGSNDPQKMYDLLGDKVYREHLAEEFKNPLSNFRLAIVVDMWITGFDVPCLNVLYNDKPLQNHTLIQTISRVNRTYEYSNEEGNYCKSCGLIVDYIGIHKHLQVALKQFESAIDGLSDDDLKVAYKTFSKELQELKKMFINCTFINDFTVSDPHTRLKGLQAGAEYVLSQDEKTFQHPFREHLKRLRSAYNICHPAGRLSDQETTFAQCFIAVGSFINKITDGPHDFTTMNKYVAQMIEQAIVCNTVEDIFKARPEEDIFSDEFLKQLNRIALPHTKFQLLLKLLRRVIQDYKKTNISKSISFAERLNEIVKHYNTREQSVQQSLQKLLDLYRDIEDDKTHTPTGLTAEECTYYDIFNTMLQNQGDGWSTTDIDGTSRDFAHTIQQVVEKNSCYADWQQNRVCMSTIENDIVKWGTKNNLPMELNNILCTQVKKQLSVLQQ